MVDIGEDDKVLLINSDDTAAVSATHTHIAYAITYGFNSKATLTASSINDDSMVLCLQRTIVDLNGKEIEPQEFSISVEGDYKPEVVMLVAAICLISGIPVETLSGFVF